MTDEEIIELLKGNVIQGRRDENDEGVEEGMVGKPGVRELTEMTIKAGINPKVTITEGLIAGMNVVGEKYEAEEYFIPDMLASAEAVGIAMEVLGPYLVKSGVKTKGKVILATVKGDLHDIGKSVVSLLLKGAGYEVKDLGVDISPERIVDAVKEEKPDFLGLSALLTTTMRMMGETINKLKEAGLKDKVKVLVGGAAVSQEFANEIGADAYGIDGFHAVRLVGEFQDQGKRGMRVERSAYDEAIKSGKYEKPPDLLGKYDNVRRFWEDEAMRIFLSPYLEQLVAKRDKLRILDLGCGSGDGYELLMGVKRTRDVGASQYDVSLMTPELLKIYKGIDINPSLIEQAKALHNNKAGVIFQEMDFNHLPSEFEEELPYDLYFASYGTLSHNTDEQTVRLLSNIAKHGRDGSIILCDWLGRYSYEWQTLWTKDLRQNMTVDYLISYIYSDEENPPKSPFYKGELSSFPLRLLSREEALAIIEQSSRQARVEMKLKELFDRSIFMGRHIDTAQYNPFCRPVRRALNSLLEPNVRTNLEELVINYVPKEGFPSLNEFYKRLEGCWNALVTYTIELVQHSDAEGTPIPIPADVQEPVLRKAMLEMERAVSSLRGLNIADPRANIIEPQLCYGLRELEMGMQEGRGCGHGLVAILELHK